MADKKRRSKTSCTPKNERKEGSLVSDRTISTAELAEIAGVTSQYLGQLEKAGVTKRVGHGRWPLSAIGDIAAFRAGEVSGEGEAPTLTQARMRLVELQCQRAQLDLDERLGKLQSREENEAAAIQLVLDTKKHLLAVPTRCGQRLVLNRHDLQVIEEEIHDALLALSKGPFPKEEKTSD
jgi:phage terminase Nu1 subunit (DNA packaging protein)